MKKEKNLQLGKSLFLVAICTLLVLGLILSSWGTVCAAQDSLPGDLLYAVKLAHEDLQLAFTPDTHAKIQLLTSFADNRVEEAATLALQGQTVPDELQTLVDGYLEEIVALTADMDAVTQEEVLDGVQRHLRPRDQDRGMTNPKDNSENPDNRHQQGKGQDSADIAVEIMSISTTSEISVTEVITPGAFGPGPCLMPDCTAPLAEEHSPGPYLGIPSGAGNHEGYGPGYIQGQGYQQNGTGGNSAQSQNGQQ